MGFFHTQKFFPHERFFTECGFFPRAFRNALNKFSMHIGVLWFLCVLIIIIIIFDLCTVVVVSMILAGSSRQLHGHP